MAKEKRFSSDIHNEPYRTIKMSRVMVKNTSTAIKPLKFGRVQVGNPQARDKRFTTKQPVVGASS